MTARSTLSPRAWIVGSVLLVLILILAANAHFLFVAVSSQPDCAVETVKTASDGTSQVLQPAKGSC